MSKTLPRLFANNRAWAKRMCRQDPRFFKKLVGLQTPHYLWIGCSDSRVPSNTIVGLLPGDVFVQRNVANLVESNDLNCQSVIQFAVDILKVKHIIVCGHYECGGVRAVIEERKLGLVNQWLRPLVQMKKKFAADLEVLPSAAERVQKLCELNVTEQVLNVCKTKTVQAAWKRRQPLTIHGWVYSIKDGLLHDLLENPVRSMAESREL
jgi:carbonic anhydrase